MLHELFITHYTNGTLIMNPFTFIKEILKKYINLENSCLTDAEKMEVRDMMYEYNDAFNLRDERGTCPNIEVEIDVTDKTPFLLDHIMQKKRTKIPWTKK